MILADFGIAAVIILACVLYVCLMLRSLRRRRNPPLTTEQITALLEQKLREIDKEIEG